MVSELEVSREQWERERGSLAALLKVRLSLRVYVWSDSLCPVQEKEAEVEEPKTKVRYRV